MDPVVMIFVLIVLLIVGGLIVSFPLMRRLGDVLETWADTRKGMPAGEGEADELRSQLEGVRQRLEAVESRLELLAERQSFTESLVEGGDGEGRGLSPPAD